MGTYRDNTPNYNVNKVIKFNDFENKKDLRNLLLQYGDTSTPFRKTYPSIGTKETIYDTTDDYIKQNPISVQL